MTKLKVMTILIIFINDFLCVPLYQPFNGQFLSLSGVNTSECGIYDASYQKFSIVSLKWFKTFNQLLCNFCLQVEHNATT